MSNEVSFNGNRIVSGSVEIPAYGLWAADITMATDAQLSASGPLVIGDLSLQAAVYRQASFAGTRRLRLVGGFTGGWLESPSAQEYQNPAGLTRSLVLNDLAAAVGEKVNVVTDATFGAFFFRKGTGASKKVLDQLVGRTGWWIDPTSGIAQVGATRRSSLISSTFTVNSYDGNTGNAVISTETPSDWIPGRTWSSPTVTTTQTIGAVHHAIVDGKLRTEALGTFPNADPVIGPLRDVIADLSPDIVFSGTWEYAVQNVNASAQTLDCLPTASSVLAAPFPLPQHVTGVPMLVGVAGTIHTPTVGSIVLLAFANGDPSKPRIVGYDGTFCPSVKINGGSHPVALADALASALASACTSAESAAAPGDGGHAAFVAFASSLASAVYGSSKVSSSS